ncbi:MAG TPA: hypothetical protein VLT33_44015 [Labilithrix sp.]|nr:hypothetical protein [Labilithrix sp.]
MRATNFITSGTLLLAAIAACSGETTVMRTGSDGVAANDVATYEQLALHVQSAAESYRTNMMGAGMTSLASCQGMHDGYDSQVRPWISQMAQMSGGMDGEMGAHGGATSADMGCVSGRMMDELDHHRQVACTAPELPVDRSEATRHAGMMTSYGAHMRDRTGQMMNGLDGGTWSWGPMMDGCQGWHDGGTMRDGGMMSDGGMMRDGGMMGGR